MIRLIINAGVLKKILPGTIFLDSRWVSGNRRNRELKCNNKLSLATLYLIIYHSLEKLRRDGKKMAIILGIGIESNFIYRLKILTICVGKNPCPTNSMLLPPTISNSDQERNLGILFLINLPK